MWAVTVVVNKLSLSSLSPIPPVHGIAGEVGAVVGNNRARLAAPADDCRQIPGFPARRSICPGPRQTFLGDIVDDVEEFGSAVHWRTAGKQLESAKPMNIRTDGDLFARFEERPLAHAL